MQQDGTPAAAARPVFVDVSGRRERIIHRVFLAISALMLGYVGMVALALVGPPGLSRLVVPGIGPVLPGPAAPPLRSTTGDEGTPARVLPSRSPSPDATSPSPRVPPSPVGTSVGGTPSPTASPTQGAPSPHPAGPSPQASGTPGSGRATPAPRATKTPPGRSTARPSPQNSHAKGRSPEPSPSL